MTKITHISCVIIAKDAAQTIAATLDSLKAFEDVVLYLNDTSDETEKIASSYLNVRVIHGEFLGFGWTKNHAISFAKNDWIIIVDSDEVVDSQLLETLKSKELDSQKVYLLNFKAFYKEIQIKHSGWNNQKIKRVFNRKVTRYNDNDVHEDIITESLKTEELDGNMEHYSYQNIEQFIEKANRYSTLFAQNNVGKKFSSPTKAFFNGIYSFFRTYFLKRGFLDGYAGLLIAFSHMATNFYKYLKLYELNEELKKEETKE